MKYKQWLNEWLENYVKISTKTRTYLHYKQIVNGHLNDKLGKYEMNDLTPLILQKYISELLKIGNLNTGKGLSSNSVNSIINVIQNSIRTAFNLGYIDKDVSNKIIRPKSVGRPIECLSIVEQRKIEKEILENGKTHLFGIILCLYTGLRLGELLALEWNDIDFSKGILTVNKSCYDGKRLDGSFGRITDTPKTLSSIRTIPLPKSICKLFRTEKKKSISPFVVTIKGEKVSIRRYQRCFSNLLKKINIPHYGFHSLRHTFATRALECGMDVKTLSEILGHKNPMVTLNRYAHSMLEHKKR